VHIPDKKSNEYSTNKLKNLPYSRVAANQQRYPDANTCSVFTIEPTILRKRSSFDPSPWQSIEFLADHQPLETDPESETLQTEYTDPNLSPVGHSVGTEGATRRQPYRLGY